MRRSSSSGAKTGRRSLTNNGEMANGPPTNNNTKVGAYKESIDNLHNIVNISSLDAILHWAVLSIFMIKWHSFDCPELCLLCILLTVNKVIKRVVMIISSQDCLHVRHQPISMAMVMPQSSRHSSGTLRSHLSSPQWDSPGRSNLLMQSSLMAQSPPPLWPRWLTSARRQCCRP